MIIANGRIVADGAPENLEKLSPYHNAVLIDSQSKNIVKDLQALEIVSSVEEFQSGRYRIYPTNNKPIVSEIANLAQTQGWSPSRLSVESPRLDEVFR